MSLFDHGKPEEFLLFVCNLNTTLTAKGTLEADVKIRYIRTLVRGEVLRQSELFCDYVENTETLIV